MSPGLDTTGCRSGQTVSFDATASHGATTTASVYFEGSSSICESPGAGTLSGGITGIVTYTRTFNIVTLSGNVSIGGTAHTISGGTCVFTPTSFNPVTSFLLDCALAVS